MVRQSTVRMKGPIPSWASLGEDLRDLLSRLGYQRLRLHVHAGSVEVTGVRGWRVLDLLLRQLPFVEWIGFGAQIGAHLRARTSLNTGDERVLLTIRCLPTRLRVHERDWHRNVENDREGPGEHRQADRSLREILARLDDAGRLAPAE